MGCVVLLIFLPSVGLMAGFRLVLYVASIAFAVLNLAFYVSPSNYRLIILKKRMLLVYLPSLIILGVCAFDLIDTIVNLDILAIASVLFTAICAVQAITFSLLVARLSANAPALLG